MGLLKDMFSGDPWRKIDPEGRFKNKLMDILDTWEFSKLGGLMEMYRLFEHDFFRSEGFTKSSDDMKLVSFVVVINNWAAYLVKNGQLKDAEMILHASIKLQNEGNSAHIFLTMLLAQTDRLKEATEEAKAALKAMDTIEAELQNIEREEGIPILDEYQLGDTTEMRQGLYEIIKASEEI